MYSFIENHDSVVLNTSTPTHFYFTRTNMWCILDLAITSRSIACNCSTEITNEFLGSDHSIISIRINHVQPALDNFLPRWLLSKANWSNFRLLCDSKFSDTLNYRSVSEIYSAFEDCMREAAVASIRQSKNSHKISAAWWNKECELAVKNKKHAFNHVRRTKRPFDILIFKRRRAIARKVILAAKQQSWSNYCTSINNNTNVPVVWRTIKKFSGSLTFTRIPQLEQNSIRANNNQHKANVLGNQFQAVSSSSDYSQAFTRNLPTLHGELRKAILATRPRGPRINAFFQ